MTRDGPSVLLISHNMKTVNTLTKFPAELLYNIKNEFLSRHIGYFLPSTGQDCPIDQTARNIALIDLPQGERVLREVRTIQQGLGPWWGCRRRQLG